MRKQLIKGEIAKLFKISKAALRYYEDKEIIKPQKSENGYNSYDWEDIKESRLLIPYFQYENNEYLCKVIIWY